jgi:hypothetical protein
MNDRLFHMFDKRKSARVSLEDLLHGLHVLSGDSKKDKLARMALDMTLRGPRAALRSSARRTTLQR